MAKNENKTKVTEVSPADFIASVEHPTRKADAEALDAMFRKVTGFKAKMWGPSIVGYGAYEYRYDTGREGKWLATGFSPRKGNLSIYILPGYEDFPSIMERLGKHKFGKSCLYINKLADVDMDVLEELVRAGLDRLGGMYEVTAS